MEKPERKPCLGAIIEISDISGRKGQTFAHIRKVAADWDGADPIRVIRT